MNRKFAYPALAVPVQEEFVLFSSYDLIFVDSYIIISYERKMGQPIHQTATAQRGQSNREEND